MSSFNLKVQCLSESTFFKGFLLNIYSHLSWSPGFPTACSTISFSDSSDYLA